MLKDIEICHSSSEKLTRKIRTTSRIYNTQFDVSLNLINGSKIQRIMELINICIKI